MKKILLLFLMPLLAWGQGTANNGGAVSPGPISGGSGAGTVSVVGAGTLTSGALVTGGGSQSLQTPYTASGLDSNGKLTLPEFFTTPFAGTTGTTNAITAGEIIIFATFVNGTTTTLTLPVTPAANDYFYVYLIGCNGSATLTTSATVKRMGDSSSGTLLTPNQVSGSNANHILKFWYDGTSWYYSDTFSAAINLAGTGSGGVTGNLPGSNGGGHVWAATVDGGGTALVTGVQIPVKVPYGFTVTGYTVTCSPSGSVTFNIFRSANGAGLPTASIINNAGGGGGTGTLPAIAAGVEGASTTLTNWGSTAITASDNLALNLTTVDGVVTKVSFILYGN